MNYPHMIMDNNFTMPSRTQALVYGDDYDIIASDMVDSLKNLCDFGMDYIILVCGTAMLFLKTAIRWCQRLKKKYYSFNFTWKYQHREGLEEEWIKETVDLPFEGNKYPDP